MKKIIIVTLLLVPSTVLAAPFSKDSYIATDAAATSSFVGNFSVEGAVQFNLGDGLLSIANGLLSTASVQSPLFFSNNTLGCQVATSTQDGCLSAADWIRFDQAAQGGGGGTPAGNNGEIQFNNNGAFGANNKFVFSPTTGFLGVGTSTQYRSNQRWEFMSETADANGTTLVHTNYNSGFAPVASFLARTARGTAASPSAVLNNDGLGVFGFSGFDGASFPASAPTFIRGFASENWNNSAWGSGIQFFTTANGGTTRTEKMRITGNGNIGVGTTSPLTKLSIQGDSIVSGNFVVGESLYLPSQSGQPEADCLEIQANTGLISASGAGGCHSGQSAGGQGGNFGVVAIWTGVRNLYSDALAFDFLNKRLGIGTITPQRSIDILNSGTTTIRMDSSSAGTGSCLAMKDSDGSGYSYITVNDGVLSASTIPCD